MRPHSASLRPAMNAGVSAGVSQQREVGVRVTGSNRQNGACTHKLCVQLKLSDAVVPATSRYASSSTKLRHGERISGMSRELALAEPSLPSFVSER